MPVDHIRYDILAQEALRGVVRTVLVDAAKNGLPGEHHFKITFSSVAPGVQLSDRMRAQYPETMTIILQHQFWDLTVDDDGFEVGLSFGGVPERLAVPFDAITAFYDPAVQFGFQFEAIDAEASGDAGKKAESSDQASDKTLAGSSVRPAGDRTTDVLPGPGAAKPQPAATEAEGHSGGGEVVRLDRFRKK